MSVVKRVIDQPSQEAATRAEIARASLPVEEEVAETIFMHRTQMSES